MSTNTLIGLKDQARDIRGLRWACFTKKHKPTEAQVKAIADRIRCSSMSFEEKAIALYRAKELFEQEDKLVQAIKVMQSVACDSIHVFDVRGQDIGFFRSRGLKRDVRRALTAELGRPDLAVYDQEKQRCLDQMLRIQHERSRLRMERRKSQ